MNNNDEFKNYLIDGLTDSQTLAVDESGEIIVSAAAGSGKTSTMIKRILRLVLDGVSIKDMLVLVYNNAAADELREKLYDALFDMACRVEKDKQTFVKKQLDELSFAHISTIHAYCQSLIKENFNYLGISPTFEVLDEDAHAEYMNEALDCVFDAYDKEGDETFLKIVQIFSLQRKEENLKNNIIKLFKVIDVQPDKNKFFENVRASYLDFENSKFLSIIENFEKDFFTRATKVIGSCLEIFKRCGEENPKEYGAYRDRIVNAYVVAERMASAKDFDEMCAVAESFEDVPASKKKNWDEIYYITASRAKACVDDMKKEFDLLKSYYGKREFLKLAHSQNAEIIEKLIEISARFSQELERLKAEDNVLAFEDLQHRAVELLSKEDAPVQKFKQVFVDEYQDVNPTQEYIISKLVDGNCFMVGDTKQSIYAFRLADPTNFLNRQARYESGEGKAIYFNRNFRSSRQILQFVNGVFDVIMTKDTASVDYKNTARFELDKAPDDGNVELHLFYAEKDGAEIAQGVYDIESDKQKEEDLSSADCEGIFVANKISELVGKLKKADGKYLSYGDVSIIAGTRSSKAQKIVAQLKKAGIPVDDGGFEKLNSSPETELVQFLKVIDNPRQDIPFAGFLLSFFGGYTEQELADVASVKADGFYNKFLVYGLTKDDALAKKIKETQAMLDLYRTKASFKNVRDLAGGIISDFSYDAYLMKKGEAEVYGLKSFVSQISDKNNDSLGKFLREYGVEKTLKSAQPNSDRVHVSTFHGYKGLENEVVFVCDLDNGFSSFDVSGDLIIDGGGYIAMNYFDFEKKQKSDVTISKFAVKKLYEKKSMGEQMRLMYVALTRAKRHMYLTSTISKSKLDADFGKVSGIATPGSMLDFIGIAMSRGLNVFCVVHGKSEFIAEAGETPAFALPKGIDELKEKIERAQAFSYPHKAATELAIKYSVSALDALDEQTVSTYAEGDFKNVGTIYHKIMQYIDYFALGVDGVKKEIQRLVDEKYLTLEEVEEIREVDGDEFEKKIARCLESEVMAYARENEKLGRCMREKAFMMYKPAREVSDDFDVDEKVLVQGVVDLFINGDKKIIVDFKNSYLKDADTLKKYEKQLNLYKNAIESAVSCKVDEIMLYSFKSGECIKF